MDTKRVKVNIFILSTLLFTILLIGCTQQIETKQIPLDDEIAESKEVGIQEEKIEEAKRELALKACEKLENEVSHLSCMAIVREDPFICEEIKEDDIPNEESIERCYFNVAIETEDISLCEKSYYKEICYLSIAKAKKEASICDNIDSSLDRKDCYEDVEEVKGNINVCTDKISPDDCYQTVAIARGDPDICDKIEEEGRVALVSRDICYRNVAALKEDINICESITEEAEKLYCKALVKKDEKICGKIASGLLPNNYEKRISNYCYKEIAQIKEDPSICAKVSLNRDACYLSAYYEVAITLVS